MSVQEIEAAARDWYAAIAKVDIDTICAAYAEDGTWFDSFPMRFQGGKQYEEFTRWAMAPMETATAQLYQVESRMLGEDTGLVTAHDSFTVVFADGSRLRMMGRATFVFSKESGEWKMIHGHFSPQVAEPPART